ncbi:MAG: lysylphosphatidylglycerol synthase transmembrane domain-containing protein [Gemmataceae bacterium]
MNRRLLLDLLKYALAAALLVWVVRANWAPAPPARAVASLAAATVGLAAHPLTAVAPLTPGRIDPPGLGYVWHHHVELGEPVHAGYLALAFAVYAVAVFLTLVRWFLLVRALGLDISFAAALRFGLIGVFFNTFLPGAVGGDLVKAAALASGQKRRAAAFATVVMDRLIALWSLVWFVALLGGLALRLGWLDGPAYPAASFIVSFALTVAAVTGVLWMLMGLLPASRADRFAERLTKIPAVGGTAAEFWRAAWMYRTRQGTVAAVMLITWAGQFGFLTAFYFGLLALWSPVMGAIPTFTQHVLLVPMGVVMQALMPTPGGAGGGEWGFGALYLLFRASESNGVLASLVQRLFAWTVGLIGYGLYLWYRPAPQPAPADAPASPEPRLHPRTPSAVAG